MMWEMVCFVVSMSAVGCLLALANDTVVLLKKS